MKVIYTTYNIINGKEYTGKHSGKQLLGNGPKEYLGSGTDFKKDIKKYGKENFIIEVIDKANTEEELNKLEAYYVDEEYVAREDTYNMKVGGDGGFQYINQQVAEGKIVRDVTRHMGNRYWLNFYDNVATKEWKLNHAKKSSDGLKKRFKDKGRWGAQGKPHTSETKKKIGDFHRNTIWITDGTDSKRIYPDQEIPVGWNLGHSLRKTKTSTLEGLFG